MAARIKLEIVTPERTVVDEAAEMVVAPGSLGEFGVLTGHTPFLTTLRLGTLRYVDEAGKTCHVFINQGFAEALPDKVTILAESAERRRDIDVARAEAALMRAEGRMDNKTDEEVDFVRAKAAMMRAMQRIRLVKGNGE